MTVCDRPFHQDSGKPRVSIFHEMILQAGEVMARSRIKYPDVEGVPNFYFYRDRWKYSDLLDSAQRHLLKFCAGEDMDPESNLSHLAHAACNIGMLMKVLEYAKDDR